MKDHRIQAFRTAIEGLIESLEAVIRLSRWSDAERWEDNREAVESALRDGLEIPGGNGLDRGLVRRCARTDRWREQCHGKHRHGRWSRVPWAIAGREELVGGVAVRTP